MYQKLLQTIELLQDQKISVERKIILKPLTKYIQKKLKNKKSINLNFICTHNSRRSHLSQVWAQVASAYFGIPEVTSYSGGTEETSVFFKVIETLNEQGFLTKKIADNENPVYMIKYDQDSHPIIAFSKKFDHPFNPTSGFAAILTCSQADGACPFIAGADERIPITFEDPKFSDKTPEQDNVYYDTSLQIGAEIFYVFSKAVQSISNK